MPIDSLHPQYEQAAGQWQRCRDAIAGADAIKDAGPRYLPPLSGQSSAEYNSYKRRAYYLGAAGRTLQGLAGAVFRKPPIIELPPSPQAQEFAGNVTGTNSPLERFSQDVFEELLAVGRVGVYVALPATESTTARPYLALRKAEHIINWSMDMSGDTPQMAWVILKERVVVDDADIFEPKYGTQYRLLFLDNGIFTVQLYRETEGVGQDRFAPYEGPIQPRFRGQPLDFIPFTLISPSGLEPDIEKPPLLDLVDANLHHYMLSADYNHGLHFTGLPTPFFSGLPSATEIRIGSGTAIVAEHPDAKAMYLEFEGTGLGALAEAIDKLEHYIAYMGSRLLAQPRKAVEAAETHRLRQTAEQVTVMSLAQTASQGLTIAVRDALAWMGISNPDIHVELPADVVDTRLNPQEIVAQVQLWQAGAISFETLHRNLQEGEIVPADLSVEAAQEQIAAETMPGAEGGEEENTTGSFNPADNFKGT